jgi:hypothetical protein
MFTFVDDALLKLVAGFIADHISHRQPRRDDSNAAEALVEHGVARFGRNEWVLMDEPLTLIVALRWLAESTGGRMRLLLVEALSAQTDNAKQVDSEDVNSHLTATIDLKELEDEQYPNDLLDLTQRKVVLAAQSQVRGPGGEVKIQQKKQRKSKAKLTTVPA